jgi:hypothetical protein
LTSLGLYNVSCGYGAAVAIEAINEKLGTNYITSKQIAEKIKELQQNDDILARSRELIDQDARSKIIDEINILKDGEL